MVLKNFVVTGGGGFIGSHLTEALLRAGNEVTALVHYRGDGSAGWLDDIDDDLKSGLRVVPGDVRDETLCRKVVKGSDVVLNLAALIGIPYSYQAPRSYIDTNVVGTLNLLIAALDEGVEAFVQTSTSEVYGTARTDSMDEYHPLNPQSPYAASKVGSDSIAQSFFSSYGLPVAILRPFNTFGPRQSARAVIPTIIRQLVAAEGAESTVMTLGNLDATRDFTYVADTADGFIACAKEIEKTAGKTFNLGTGTEWSIREIATVCGRIAGTHVTFLEDASRVRPENSEVQRLISNFDKAEAVFNWRPNRSVDSEFLHSVASTIEWFRQNKDRWSVADSAKYQV